MLISTDPENPADADKVNTLFVSSIIIVADEIEDNNDELAKETLKNNVIKSFDVTL